MRCARYETTGEALKRRTFLLGAPAALSAMTMLGMPSARARLPDFAAVAPGRPLTFPRDYGAHPAFRTEWWYVTGWLETDTKTWLGFQLTFFRSRAPFDDANPSRFAPRQLLFANAALSDPRARAVRHGQRAARTGFGLAQASEGDTAVHIDDWSLDRDAHGRYTLDMSTPGFGLALALQPTQPMLINGMAGYSQKGPLPTQASYYYSEPGLSVEGKVRRDNGSSKWEHVVGRAWLDHEWSSALLARDAVGWDWIGINLDEGGAVMAFQIRDANGHRFWAGGTLRTVDGRTHVLLPDEVSFTPLNWWRSPHTGAHYPIAMQVDAGNIHLTLVPLMDDQEFDGRASTGTVYWEGAVTAFQAASDSETTGTTAVSAPLSPPDALAIGVGHGYLELTGYFRRLDL